MVIESNSSSSIRLLSTGCGDHHPSAPLVCEIRSILGSFEQVTWGHVFREANSVADALAKHGMNLGFLVFVLYLLWRIMPLLCILEACS